MSKLTSVRNLIYAMAIVVVAGCGGGGGGGPAAPPQPTVAVIKVSTFGTLPGGTSISGISVTITNKNGVTAQTETNGYPKTSVVVPSGLTSGLATVLTAPYVQPTSSSTGKLDFVVTSNQAGGFGVGEFVTINYNISSGSPSSSDFIVTSIQPVDLNSAPIVGLTATITANIY